MSIEVVRKYLSDFGKGEQVMEFPVSSATVELAAQALGTAPARIAKTLSFQGPGGQGCMLVVMAGDAKVDNQKFKARFGMKARMLSHEEALAHTGHAVGGVCPFALPEGVPVYLDVSMQRFILSSNALPSWTFGYKLQIYPCIYRNIILNKNKK